MGMGGDKPGGLEAGGTTMKGKKCITGAVAACLLAAAYLLGCLCVLGAGLQIMVRDCGTMPYNPFAGLPGALLAMAAVYLTVALMYALVFSPGAL